MVLWQISRGTIMSLLWVQLVSVLKQFGSQLGSYWSKWIRLDPRGPTWVQMNPKLIQFGPKLGPRRALFGLNGIPVWKYIAKAIQHIYICIYMCTYIYLCIYKHININVWPCLVWVVVYSNLMKRISQREWIVVPTFLSNTLKTLTLRKARCNIATLRTPRSKRQIFAATWRQMVSPWGIL